MQKKYILILVLLVILVGLVCILTYTLLSNKFYFIGKVDPSFIGNSFWEVNLSECSEGQVFKKIDNKWKCALDDSKTVIGGGWDRDYDEACSVCTICGVYWGEGSCTITTGPAASFQCTQGTQRKIAEYGVSRQKTYWYICIKD